MVKAWYYLFVGDATQALKEIVAIEETIQQAEKLLWIKRAVAMRLQQAELVERYASELDQATWLPE